MGTDVGWLAQLRHGLLHLSKHPCARGWGSVSLHEKGGHVHELAWGHGRTYISHGEGEEQNTGKGEPS